MNLRPTSPAIDRSVAELRAASLHRIQEHFGFNLSDQQLRQFETIAARALQQDGIHGPAALYREILSDSGGELLNRLVADLTVGETHFFRIAPQIDALRQVVLPDIIARRAAERRVRIWSAGCSTGEEPYTLAILLRELLPTELWDIDLLGTDISRPAIETARKAIYGEWSFRDTPGWVRERYFCAEDRRWRLADAVRRMVRFDLLNLAADMLPMGERGAPFDLILCRNVTIYFNQQTTHRLYARLAESLGPDGWLVLGPSDPSPDLPGLIEPVYLTGAVLWRRRTSKAGTARESRNVPALPHSRPATTRLTPRPSPAAPAPRRIGLPVGKTAKLQAPESPGIAVGKGDVGPDLERVRMLERTGQRTAAPDLAARLVREWPLESAVHLLLGLLFLEDGALDPALDSLRRATFLDDRHALAHFSLARVYLRRGEHNRAFAALNYTRRLLSAFPDAEKLSRGTELTAGELRQAVDGLLDSLAKAGERR